ncbi:MAG: hypothetical protein ABI785_12820, partial [Gemmatimonadales bacterium]
HHWARRSRARFIFHDFQHPRTLSAPNTRRSASPNAAWATLKITVSFFREQVLRKLGTADANGFQCRR